MKTLLILLLLQSSLALAKSDFDKAVDICATVASYGDAKTVKDINLVFGRCFMLMCDEKCNADYRKLQDKKSLPLNIK
jgi:hypothetical protein